MYLDTVHIPLKYSTECCNAACTKINGGEFGTELSSASYLMAIKPI